MLKKWSAEDIEALWRLYREGLSNAEIATALGRTTPAIAGRLALLRRRERALSD